MDGFRFDFGDAPPSDSPPSTAEGLTTAEGCGETAVAHRALESHQLTAAALVLLGDRWRRRDGDAALEEAVTEWAVAAAPPPPGAAPAAGPPPPPFGTVRSRAAVHDAGLQGPDRRDMVPGAYLGGLTVWACAAELVTAVATVAASSDPAFAALRDALFGEGARVVELGCGHGLPGLAALVCGAGDVTFHDYNHEVIDRCVVPNLVLTFAAAPPPAAPTVRAAAGPWAAFAPGLEYSCVLGSDLTYDDDATRQVLAAAARLLRPGGFAVLAGKRFYFGTGGGSDAVHRLVGDGGPLRTTFHVVFDSELPAGGVGVGGGGESGDVSVVAGALSNAMVAGSSGGACKALLILQRF